MIGEHGDGTNAELIAVPATNVYPIPGDLTFEEAAAFPLVFETAYRMLVTRAHLQAGEWVLAVGHRQRRLDRGARDREGARRAHDRHVLERREARARARARRRRRGQPRERRREGGGQGGDRRPRRRRRRRARRRGDVAHVARRRRARGPDRRLRRDERPEPARAAAPRLVEAADDPRLDDGDEGRLRGRLRARSRAAARGPVVDEVLPLEEIRAAHERLEAGEQLGKIVLSIP